MGRVPSSRHTHGAKWLDTRLVLMYPAGMALRLILTDKQKVEALKRAKREPRRQKDGYICIGGIDHHGECYGHGPSPDCPYCYIPFPDKVP